MTPEETFLKTEVEALLWRSVELLGAIALRKRTRLTRREAYTLEDELFAVLELLNDLKVEPVTARQAAAVKRVAEVVARSGRK